MGKIGDLRSAVLHQATNGNPTMDIAPVALIDFYIFQSADVARREDMRQRRTGYMRVEPWMLTNITATPVALATSEIVGNKTENPIKYKIDLPFQVGKISNELGVQSVFIKDYQQAIRYVAYRYLDCLEMIEPPVNSGNPGYTFMGNTIYLFGGGRDFSKLSIQVGAIAGSAIDPTQSQVCEISESAIVAIPEGYEEMVVVRSAEKLLQALVKGKHELGTDGKVEADKQQ